MLQEKENMIEELKAKLEESQTAFKELKEEMAVSRTESQTNERILTEELGIMRSWLRELRTCNYKLLMRKGLTLSVPIQAFTKHNLMYLEEKNKTCNLTIVKHEQTIMHLKDEVCTVP
jgi:nucleoprotein TPR